MEFNGWDPAVSSELERLRGNDVLVFRDTSNQVDLQVPISELDVYSQFGFDFETAKAVSSGLYLSRRTWQSRFAIPANSFFCRLLFLLDV